MSKSYTINDRRGQDPKPLPCRVCGCPTVEHSTDYNKPTMECIKYLRETIGNLNQEIRLLTAKDNRY